MNYNFDKETNRLHTNSLKWEDEKVLPMWVADMDFETAPEIIIDLRKRVDHGIFGYNVVPNEFFIAIQAWWDHRHNINFNTDWMMFCTGVVPAISSIVRKMTTVGENVLIQAPVYNIFYNSILNNGRNVLSSDLKYDGKEYTIDFQDLEQKLANPQTTLMILCNPHNPIGKIWDKQTLLRIGELCAKHHVLVVSDEIHCDIVSPGFRYTPFASVSQQNLMNCITCVSPSKAFNLAGMQTACIIVANDQIRHKVNRGINTDEIAEPNSFAVQATISAFQKGENWLTQLNKYIYLNKQLAVSYLHKNLPELQVTLTNATYLLWINCASITSDSENLTAFIKEKTGLYVSDGNAYGSQGKSFIRMNLACPKERLEDGLQRLQEGIERYKNEGELYEKHN